MLETRKIFIDTQYFVKSNFNFHSQSFKSLQKLCKSNEIQYYLTSVVEREVDNRIKLSIKDSLNSLKQFKRKANILSTIEDQQLSSLFADVAEDEVYEKASNVFHAYNQACNYEYVEADSIDSEKLLELYFEMKPPFGEGKKKAEFPDAISLLSLESCLEPDDKLYVISDDVDLKSYCEGNNRLIAIDNLEKLLDLYNEHTSVRTVKIKEYIAEQSEALKTQISEYMDDCDFYNSSSWEDAEVDGISVLEVGEIDPSVISINDEECSLTFEIPLKIEVTVTGPDFNNGTYDREEGHVYTFGHSTRTENVELLFTVELELYYEFVSGELNNIEQNSLYIPAASSGIEVDIEENGSDW
ncbi:DUF4935 domain-containing protein [Pseudoalteromonas sp. NZS127_1]|uniref:PIN domain-containing protein n=1 Tax=unclassified Pseudoalteromonas TaxID=194690 RepID=UPI0018CF6542|nr:MULTISPECIES: PIN domain-containing protein [unclassified Pseudoalteromonas]MBG9996342.1 DUF4935 domain-containing protein [Pseudoalteromonas sp. NZS127_1]MBH0013076.1 DUF4935 domain-containing protein [Pseudoalteromonas sp. NZS100_1]